VISLQVATDEAGALELTRRAQEAASAPDASHGKLLPFLDLNLQLWTQDTVVKNGFNNGFLPCRTIDLGFAKTNSGQQQHQSVLLGGPAGQKNPAASVVELVARAPGLDAFLREYAPVSEPDPALLADPASGAENALFRRADFILKPIDLPRHARDKHSAVVALF